MRFAFGVIVAVGAQVCGAGLAAEPSFALVGVRPGATQSNVSALSFNGDVAVGRMDGDFTQYVSFRWSRTEGRSEDMIPAGFSEYEYRDVSDDGRTFAGRARFGDGPYQLLISRNGVESRVSAPGGGAVGQVVSPDGSAVGGSIAPAPGWSRGSVWTADGGFRVLDPLVTTDQYGVVNGLSAAGEVAVGVSWRDGDPLRPVRWWPDGRVEALGALPGSSFPDGTAQGVSADGAFVAGNGASADGGRGRAVRWNALGEAEDLGVLPGFSQSNGWSISADGRVIVGSSYNTSSQVACVWTEGDGMMPLAEYLLGHGVPIPAGVRLRECYSVSGDGMSFGGIAVDAFNARVGFVATVPAPAGVCIIAGPALLLMRRRRT